MDDADIAKGLAHLGELLRARRLHLKHSQAHASRSIGISRATIQRIETAGPLAAGVSIEGWLKILHYCGLHDYFFQRLTGPEFATDRALAVREADLRNGGSMTPAQVDSD